MTHAPNPFNNRRVRATQRSKDNARRDQFTRDELTKIFSHEIFTDYAGTKARNKKLQAYRYWTPLIGLFTGARPCEIGGLDVSDINKVQGIWVFDFNGNSDKKCSKTHNAIRKTPIHSTLIALGFLDYVEQVKALGHTRLFEELKYEEKDGYARYINDRFKEVLKSTGIYRPKTKVYYSFRHTFTTELHRCKVDRLCREQLCGREAEGKSVGDKFYVKDDELKTLQEALEKVNFAKELTNVTPWKVPAPPPSAKKRGK